MVSHQTKQLFKVFVYGTLKKGESNHMVLSSNSNGFAEYACDGITSVKFPLIIGTRRHVPFLLNVPNIGHNISGGIYSIDEKMFNHLDTFESYPQLYNRHILDVNGSDGNIHQCWTYMLDQYPDEFIRKSQFHSVYQNTVEQAYVKSTGDPNENLLNLVRALDQS